MLKLAKLPDRTPAKIIIAVSADLNQALHDYAALYRATYGEAENVPELIPFMLAAFLDSDRAFAKARKQGLPESEPDKSRRGRPSRMSPSEPGRGAMESPSAKPFAQHASQQQEE